MYTEMYPEWIKTNVSNKSADFNATFGQIYLVDNGANTVTATLPAPKIGQAITFKHTGADLDAFALTITPQIGDNIDGVAGGKVIKSLYSSITLVSDGIDWFII